LPPQHGARVVTGWTVGAVHGGRAASGGRRRSGAAPSVPPPYPGPVAEIQGHPRLRRRLLDAILTVGSGLDLPTILRRVVETATDLVDARYGALGVLDESGTRLDRKSTRLNSSHVKISYAVFC